MTTDEQVKTGTWKMRQLPFTLPSLRVAVVLVPFPMSENDLNYLMGRMDSCRAALLQQIEQESDK